VACEAVQSKKRVTALHSNLLCIACDTIYGYGTHWFTVFLNIIPDESVTIVQDVH
jgi:hypothetical protein